MLGVEPWIDALRVLEAPQEEAGTNQRDQRQGNLRCDEQVAQAEQPVRSRRRARLLLQFDDQVGARRLNRRREAEEDAGCE